MMVVTSHETERSQRVSFNSYPNELANFIACASSLWPIVVTPPPVSAYRPQVSITLLQKEAVQARREQHLRGPISGKLLPQGPEPAMTEAMGGQ